MTSHQNTDCNTSLEVKPEMNIDKIIKAIKDVSAKKYPGHPEVPELCENILRWERDNISFLKPRYKEPYKNFLKAAQKQGKS